MCFFALQGIYAQRNAADKHTHLLYMCMWAAGWVEMYWQKFGHGIGGGGEQRDTEYTLIKKQEQVLAVTYG